MTAAVDPHREVDSAAPEADEASGLKLGHQFVSEVPGLFAHWRPTPAPVPRMLQFNEALAVELGLDPRRLGGAAGLAVFSGQKVPQGAQPVAQAYAGHQFGHYSPRLGDGRALLLGDLDTPDGRRVDIALKGSGRTPFARGGDGKAAVGPVLREFLVSEAMHAMGIPTTRALAAVATGEPVLREQVLPGAVLTRVAASHLRVGSFEYAARSGDTGLLARLAEHALARHDPVLAIHSQRHLAQLKAVVERQARLVAQWMGVGFIHGVMNTDNMTISGETIDYGPCAFMERFDADAVFSSIDTQGRYAWGNQPVIARWNLARLAETLLPLIHANAEHAKELAMTAVQGFDELFLAHWRSLLRAKIGLPDGGAEADELTSGYLALMQRHQVDWTLGFRRLGDAATGDEAPLRTLFGEGATDVAAWLSRWRGPAAAASLASRAQAMAAINPVVIPRNHRVEEALSSASAGDLRAFELLLQEVRRPFDERSGESVFTQPASREQTDRYQTFCGT